MQGFKDQIFPGLIWTSINGDDYDDGMPVINGCDGDLMNLLMINVNII